uniref:Uncharacterized AAA domain-containing protein ycf46 n=1 Tax=Candidatus Kentrum sp. FM TaxID=2126340 RepID=A0A450VL63_9GAMM|nr:MAG: AAA+-type ATPase, SpoVK/Ycf46/Vps4 family [Candidatus Kentron sp. FM]VFJ43327.1 MAG: AAA+-type ATPase, SpoVK/Ycf46/Vps4 family [Candidatus Kentron sp. FM]VFK05491.1 MAG: AAA+-type ATPase, SpoVK/Ycf46/Vps4 family [Candidatus Kentron sp. FM]
MTRLNEGLNQIDEEISRLLRARFPILSIVSYEEWRVLGQIEGIRQDLLAHESNGDQTQSTEADAPAVRYPILRWSVTDGLLHWCRDANGHLEPKPVVPPNVRDPKNPLDLLFQLRFPPEKPVDGVDLRTALYVFCDLHIWLDREDRGGRFNHVLVRALRDFAHASKFRSEINGLILLSPRSVVPLELNKEIQVIDYPLPTVDQMAKRFEQREVEMKKSYGEDCVKLDSDERERLMQALSGLTYDEAENVLAKSLANDGRLKADDIAEVLNEKRQIIEKDGILEYFESNKGLNDVGGLENLLTWLKRRHQAFKGKKLDVDAQIIQLPIPKAVLLIGVPGGGKSLVAKAVAKTWDLPLLRLDIGRIFGGLVGQSEENMRRAIRIAENVAPTVLWLDEVEKAFPKSSGSTDSGTSLRVMNTFLTWLQEKKAPVFVVATGNDIDQVPPELTRKGRFDEIFYVGLPEQDTRKKILEIHTRDFPLEEQDYRILAEKACRFTGAEIEQAIANALFLVDDLQRGERPFEPLPGEPNSLLAQAIYYSLHTMVPLADRLDRRGQSVLKATLDKAKEIAIPASEHFEDLDNQQSPGQSIQRSPWSGEEGRFTRH